MNYYPITNKYSWRAFIRERPEEYKAFKENYKELKAQEEHKRQAGLEEKIVRGYN